MKKSTLKITIACLLVASTFSCVRFKVDKLSASEVFSIQFGQKSSQYDIEFRQGFPVNMPSAIYAGSDEVYLPNMAKGRVQVFDSGGSLKLMLGGNLPGESKNFKAVSFPITQAVRIIPGDDDSFYVQNRITQETPKAETEEGMEFNPNIPFSSYILHFNENGELISSIGQQGKNSAPFGFIERMNIDSQGRLLVLHHAGLEKVLAWYDKKGKILREIGDSMVEINKTEEDAELNQEFENMIPFPDGDTFLVSVAYREKEAGDNVRFRLRYRKIYKFNSASPSGGKLMLEISDPRESLFWTNSKDGFYVWQSENSARAIRLQVYDNEGTHINNKLIELDGTRSNWRRIYADLDDNIFSMYTDSKTLQLYNWN